MQLYLLLHTPCPLHLQVQWRYFFLGYPTPALHGQVIANNISQIEHMVQK